MLGGNRSEVQVDEAEFTRTSGNVSGPSFGCEQLVDTLKLPFSEERMIVEPELLPSALEAVAGN